MLAAEGERTAKEAAERRVAELEALVKEREQQLERLQDAISPSRRGMVSDDYYVRVAERMRASGLKIKPLGNYPRWTSNTSHGMVIPYSAIYHLASTVWIANYMENVFGMFAVNCYFDCSRDSRATFTVVSGWLATVGQWERFDADWRIMLARYDIPYLHMKEFAHSVGPFAKLKGNETKRTNILRTASDIIQSNVLRGLACIVDHEVFNKVNSIYDLSGAVGVPFSLAGRDCAAHANLFIKTEQRGIPVKYIFDRGEPGWGDLLRVMGKDKLPTPIPGNSRDDPETGEVAITPLQAADFAAYELYKAQNDIGNNDAPLWKYRNSLKALAKIPAWWGRYSEKNLIDMCEQVPIRKRETDSIK